MFCQCPLLFDVSTHIHAEILKRLEFKSPFNLQFIS